MSRVNGQERTTEVRAYVLHGQGRDGPVTRLRIDDCRSNISFLEVELDAEAFRAMLSSSMGLESTATVRVSENIGRWSEHRSEEFPISEGDEDWARAKGRELSGDGWQFTGCSRNNRAQWVLRFVRYHDAPVSR